MSRMVEVLVRRTRVREGRVGVRFRKGMTAREVIEEALERAKGEAEGWEEKEGWEVEPLGGEGE